MPDVGGAIEGKIYLMAEGGREIFWPNCRGIVLPFPFAGAAYCDYCDSPNAAEKTHCTQCSAPLRKDGPG